MSDKPGEVETERLRAQLLQKDQAIEQLQREFNAQKQATDQFRASSERWQSEHTRVTRELNEIRAQRNFAWGAVGLAALLAGFSGGKRIRIRL